MEHLTPDQRQTFLSLSEEDRSKLEQLDTEQQSAVLLVDNEKARKAVLDVNFKNKQIGDGSYWTPLEKLYGRKPESYEGGFDNICLRVAHDWNNMPKDYRHIVNDLRDLIENNVNAEDISVHSAKTKTSDSSPGSDSNRSNNKTRQEKLKYRLKKYRKAKENPLRSTVTKPDFLGGTSGNKGHLIPAPRSLCAPRYGIMVQPVIGFSFEDQVDAKIRTSPGEADNLKRVLKKVLQKAVISDKQPQGLANREENLLYVSKEGHETHFDVNCQWLVVPVMTLEEALLEWRRGGSYKVMVVAGDFRRNDPEQSAKMYKNLIHSGIMQQNNTCILEEPEIRKATIFLEYFVKALADMATGRGGDALLPEDLDRQDENLVEKYDANAWIDKVAELVDGKENLERDGTVLVPDLSEIDFSNVRVLGVTITDGPDPACLGIKSGVNIMTQNYQRPLPGCLPHDNSESEEGDSDSESTTPDIPREVACVQFISSSPPPHPLSRRVSFSSEHSFGSL